MPPLLRRSGPRARARPGIGTVHGPPDEPHPPPSISDGLATRRAQGAIWERGDDRIRVTMDESPRTLLTSKGAGHPQGERGDFLSPANSCCPLLHLKNRREVRSCIRGERLEAPDRSVPKSGRGEVERIGDLLPATYRWAKGVRESHVVSMRKHVLHRLRVAS